MSSSPVVLLTRPAGSNEKLAALLAEAGFSVVINPALKLVPLRDADEILEIWNRWRATAGDGLVVVTSTETVRLLVSAGVPVDTGVAAVGPATARAARDAGWRVLDLVSVDAASLAAALIAESIEGTNVWLPQSAQADVGLQTKLEQAGANVTTTPLYGPVPQVAAMTGLLGETDIDLVIFFSASAARAFAEADAEWRGRAVCVGASTAAVATELGFGEVIVANAPTDEAVLQVMRTVAAPTGKAG